MGLVRPPPRPVFCCAGRVLLLPQTKIERFAREPEEHKWGGVLAHTSASLWTRATAAACCPAPSSASTSASASPSPTPPTSRSPATGAAAHGVPASRGCGGYGAERWGGGAWPRGEWPRPGFSEPTPGGGGPCAVGYGAMGLWLPWQAPAPPPQRGRVWVLVPADQVSLENDQFLGPQRIWCRGVCFRTSHP